MPGRGGGAGAAVGQVLGNLAMCLWRQGRSAEAEPLARRELALEPADADAHQHLALILAQQGGWEEAEVTLRAGLDAQPLHAGLRRNLGYLLLTQGRWDEGWPLHEARLETMLLPTPPSLCWLGEELAGRSLLLCLEQGYGDALQMARYLPELLRRGPGRMIVACRPVLLPLLQAQGWPWSVAVGGSGGTVAGTRLPCVFDELARPVAAGARAGASLSARRSRRPRRLARRLARAAKQRPQTGTGVARPAGA